MRLNLVVVFAVVIFAAACASTPDETSAAVGTGPNEKAADLIATWKGRVADVNPPLPVTITITAVQPDSPAGTLHFGGRRACRLDVDYAGPDEASFVFTTKRPTGGYCSKLDFGSLDLRFAKPSTALTFTVSKSDGTVTDSGTVIKHHNGTLKKQ